MLPEEFLLVKGGCSCQDGGNSTGVGKVDKKEQAGNDCVLH